MARILCIEDEPDLRADIVGELNDAGHETLEAGDGKAGLEAISRYRPDVVLCDVQMPVMDGLKVLRAVRKSWLDFGGTPFIMLTAYSDTRLVKRCLKQGANDYLLKPVDFKTMLQRVDRVLEGGRRATYDKIIGRQTATSGHLKTRGRKPLGPVETPSAS